VPTIPAPGSGRTLGSLDDRRSLERGTGPFELLSQLTLLIVVAKENDTCHFYRMSEAPPASPICAHRAGRPRRGTETARIDALINAATRVFLRDGYGLASIDKVASEAGVSTRTIYERFKNKADLLGAVIRRLVDRMATVIASADLDGLEPRSALMSLARTMIERARDPDSAALFRIVATEAHRFPELAAQMRANDKRCVDGALAHYLRREIKRGTLVLADPDKAAALFLQMVFAELHECWLFGDEQALAQLDLASHLQYVIDLFLLGAAPRAAPASGSA
jgi:TetR/AcrR family transcriptional regulator, mexJK operon transcriptional repressor